MTSLWAGNGWCDLCYGWSSAWEDRTWGQEKAQGLTSLKVLAVGAWLQGEDSHPGRGSMLLTKTLTARSPMGLGCTQATSSAHQQEGKMKEKPSQPGGRH